MSNTDDGSPPNPRTPDPRWWRPAIPNAVQETRYADQLQLMINALNADMAERRGRTDVVSAYPDPANLPATQFLYSTDTILTRTEDAARVLRVLGRDVDEAPPDPGRLPDPIEGLRVILLEPRPEESEGGELSPAQVALSRVEAELGPGVATFDRVVHLTSNSGCPATEPVPAKSWRPDPAVNADATLGRGVKVAVIDSGWPTKNGKKIRYPKWYWLAGADGDPELDGADPSTAPALAHYRGHGVFVAGVIRAMAPEAEVYVHSWGRTTFGQIESELAPILVKAFETSPHIISMSAGTSVSQPSAPATAGEPVLSLEVFKEKYLKYSSTLLVCAAGNDGSQGPFEPASLVWSGPHDPALKVAVGALKKKGRIAKYSNRGMWVDVYARGAKVVNAYPKGQYTYEEAPLTGRTAKFKKGMAQWSGTSFSTPTVSGLIAARMSWTHESARDAWHSLKRIAYAYAPYGLPTLRPGDADRDVQPRP